MKPCRKELGIARNTVRKYVRRVHDTAPTEAVPRPRRSLKLDPYKDQIWRWVAEDRLENCAAMLGRLQALGYTGRVSILKAFVHPLRLPAAGQHPVIRYETKPGEQLQFDWGEFVYEQEDVTHKVFGFAAMLSYARLRFVTVVKRTDAPTLICCLLAALEYCEGLPRAVLTDRMKTVLLDAADGQLHWHPLFADLVTSLGITARVCKPYTPQAKGKSATATPRSRFGTRDSGSSPLPNGAVRAASSRIPSSSPSCPLPPRCAPTSAHGCRWATICPCRPSPNDRWRSTTGSAGCGPAAEG